MKVKITGTTAETFAKRLFYKLWQASSVLGMGFMQDRGDQPEDVVWNNIMRSGDYAFGKETPINAPKTGQPRADYVFGRMMKFGLEFDNDTLTIRDQKYTPDYQSWCRRYPIIESALKETGESLNCTYTVQ